MKRNIMVSRNAIPSRPLKDLGKKWFAFSRMDIGALGLVARLEAVM